MKSTVEVIGDIKAARSNDAEIETNQWNHNLLNNFNPKLQLGSMSSFLEVPDHWSLSQNVKPLICKKGLLTKDHVNLFEQLQNLIAGKFSGNMFKCFTEYMKLKYGNKTYLSAKTIQSGLKGNKKSNIL
jgi:hypothetical protein